MLQKIPRSRVLRGVKKKRGREPKNTKVCVSMTPAMYVRVSVEARRQESSVPSVIRRAVKNQLRITDDTRGN
jgi:hypothetical protein